MRDSYRATYITAYAHWNTLMGTGMGWYTYPGDGSQQSQQICCWCQRL